MRSLNFDYQTSQNQACNLKLINKNFSSPKISFNPKVRKINSNNGKQNEYAQTKNTFYDNIYDKYFHLNENNKKTKLIMNDNHIENDVEPIKKLSKIVYPVKTIQSSPLLKLKGKEGVKKSHEFNNKIKSQLKKNPEKKEVRQMKKKLNIKSKKEKSVDEVSNNIINNEDKKYDIISNKIVLINYKRDSLNTNSEYNKKKDKKKFFCCF